MGIATEFNPISLGYDQLYAIFERARSEEPVFYWKDHDVWVVSGYDDVHTILSDDKNYTNDGNLGIMNNSYCPEARAILAQGIDFMKTPQVNGLDGPDHLRLRGVLQRILSPQRFRAIEPTVRVIVDRLIDAFIKDGHCDFVSQFCYPLPVEVIFEIIGFKAEEENLSQLQTWSDDLFRLWLVPMSDADQVRCATHAVQFQNCIKEKMADRRRSPRDDLLSEFVRQLDSGESQVSEDEVIVMVPINLIGAGHETTKSALANAVYQLLREPGRWQQIVNHPETIPQVVEECLRLDTSVIAWYRTAVAETWISGVRLPKGAKIVGLLGSANHDERKFQDAKGFCPVARGDRSGHLSFSVGKHFCIGAPLARLEMRIALEQLSRRLLGPRLKAGQEIVYEESVATRVLRRLLIEWDPA